MATGAGIFQGNEKSMGSMIEEFDIVYPKSTDGCVTIHRGQRAEPHTTADQGLTKVRPMQGKRRLPCVDSQSDRHSFIRCMFSREVRMIQLTNTMVTPPIVSSLSISSKRLVTPSLPRFV